MHNRATYSCSARNLDVWQDVLLIASTNRRQLVVSRHKAPSHSRQLLRRFGIEHSRHPEPSVYRRALPRRIPALQLLPLVAIDPPPSLPAVSKVRELDIRIYQILRDRNIDFDFDEAGLAYRVIPGEEISQETLTYFIPARWTSDEDAQQWYYAANDIRRLFVTHFLTRPVKVELLSWQLTALRTIRVVEPNHSLVAAWLTINPQIHTIIGEYPRLKEGWRSIDLLRIGYQSEEYSPTPVTVSVTVDWGLNRRDWIHAEQRIKAILDSDGLLDVEVEFERGDVDPVAVNTTSRYSTMTPHWKTSNSNWTENQI